MGRLPRSVRGNPDSVEAWQGPYEGIPAWILPSIVGWVTARFSAGPSWSGSPTYDAGALTAMERQLHLTLDWSLTTGVSAMDSVLNLLQDPSDAIDMLDWCVGHFNDTRTAGMLQMVLDEGGSAWTIGRDENGVMELQRRVDPTVTASAQSAAPRGSRAAYHLASAWSRQYGTNKDSTAAYREAVRAVEAAAQPIVSPTDPKATLGTMISAMRDKPEKWQAVLTPDGGEAIEQVVGMMKLLWKGQIDRHGSGVPDTPLSVTPSESQAAVHLAAALVHLFSSGAIATSTSTGGP